MTSTGGINQYKPESLGRYTLQPGLINDRVVYAHMETNLYLYSLTSEYEDIDGAWAVRFLFINYNSDFIQKN